MTEDLLQAIGLNHNPFSSAACTTGFFQTKSTKPILQELYYGITSRKGFLVLEGEVGVGKTSSLYQLLAMLEKEKISTAWIFNSILDRKDLLLAIAKDFELPVTQDMSLANVLEKLNTFFIDRFDKGYNTAIIIDEAHNLGAQSLETLRMLSNLEHNGQKLVQILLVGQPELKQLIDQPNLRQLRSRISIYLVLDALSPKETQRYVEFKLSNAGSELPVSPKAYALLWQGSCGNIRMINLIMERALYAIMAFGGTSLTPKIMWAALKDIAAYQLDVSNALKSRRKKIVLGWSMGICAGILLLALIPIVPVPNGQANVAQVIMNSWQSTPRPVQSPPQHIASVPAQPAPKQPNPETSSSSSDTLRTAELTRLLADHRLTHLLPVLEKAVAAKDMDSFRNSLPGDLQLIGLDKLPTNKEVLFTSFPWKKYTGEFPEWVIVWKPVLQIRDFYPYYKSDEIASLQAMLKKLKHYSGAIDGIVGPVMWKGINSFQRQMGLPRTAQPDPKTLFLIYSEYKDSIKTS